MKYFLAFLAFLAFSGLRAENFDWPSSGKVRITELVEKKGNTAKMSYYLTVNTKEARRFIRIVDLKFVSINGEKISPELEAELAPVIESLNSMPYFVVNSQGELVDIAGLTEAIDSFDNVIKHVRKEDNEPEFSEIMKSDPARKLLFDALSEYWTCWVEAWIVFPATEDKPYIDQYTNTLPGSETSYLTTRTLNNFGTYEGLTHLKVETSVTDPRITDSIKEMLDTFDQASGKPIDRNLERPSGMRVEALAEAKIDLETLRPKWVKRQKRVMITSNSSEIIDSSFESHTYTFHWNEFENSNKSE